MLFTKLVYKYKSHKFKVENCRLCKVDFFFFNLSISLPLQKISVTPGSVHSQVGVIPGIVPDEDLHDHFVPFSNI